MQRTLIHLIDNLRVGGAEKQLALFSQNIDAEKYRQIVVCMRESGPLEERLREENIRIEVLGKRHKIDVLFFVRLLRLLMREKPDLLMCWLFSANLWGRLAALFVPAVKVIATERVDGDWKAWYHRIIDRVLLSVRTDVLLANSEGVVNYCVHEERLPLKKIRVVYNAIAERERKRVVDSERTFKKVVSISRLTHQKGVDNLISVAERVRARVPGMQLYIYGEGDQKGEYEQMVHDRGLSDVVHFMGKDRVFNIMRDADVFISGSRYEGLPNAIMEAMAYGMPIVATNIGGTNELVSHEVTGLLAERDDVAQLSEYLEQMLLNKEYAELLGDAARWRINNRFLISRIVNDLYEVFDELLEGKPMPNETTLVANRVIQRLEADMFDLIHPELFSGLEKELLDRDIAYICAHGGAGGSACDIGAGTGRITLALCGAGFAVDAIELSAAMRMQLEKKLTVGQAVTVFNQDAETFLLKNKKSYDTISFSAMLHHVPAYEKLVAGAIANLNVGGYLLISHEPVLRQRMKSRVADVLINKCDSILFRLWLLLRRGKTLPVTNYAEADPYGMSGLDEEALLKVIESAGCEIVTFERYAPRKTRLMSALDQRLCNTGHQFRICAKKIHTVKGDVV